jgi:ribosomal protein L7Ae-like RNA K-turn-binding protein
VNCNGKKAAGAIGLAARAGKCASGEVAVEAALKGKKACCLLVDATAAANAQKRYVQAAQFRGIPCFILEDFDLGQAIGKPGRIVLAVTDAAFAKMIADKLMP